MAREDYFNSNDQFDEKVFRESLGTLGTTTAPGEDQLKALQVKVRQGVKHVELHLASQGKGEFGKQDVPDKYGFEQRRTIMQLAKLNRQTLSVHGTFNVNSFAGLGRSGFDEMQRNNNIKEIDETVKFASETAKGGAVVFHLHETQVPMSAGEINLSQRYLDFLKEEADKGNQRYKKEFDKLNSIREEVSKNPFAKQFQDNPNMESEIKIRFEREKAKDNNLLTELKQNGLTQDHVGYYEYLEKQKLELEQDGTPFVVVGESLQRAQRNQEVVNLEGLKTLSQKEKNFLQENYIETDSVVDNNGKISDKSTFNIDDFNRLKEIVSTRYVNGRNNKTNLTNDEFLDLRKKLSKDYYDVYKDTGRQKSRADQEFQKMIVENQLNQIDFQIKDLDLNRSKYGFYVKKLEDLKREEIKLERDLKNAKSNEERFKIQEKLIGSDRLGEKAIKEAEEKLYKKNSLTDEEKEELQRIARSIDNIQERAREIENDNLSEEQRQRELQELQLQYSANENRKNQLENKKVEREDLTPEERWDLKRRLDGRGRSYLSRGGIKGEIDFLNYEAIGQTEFNKLERYEEQVAQLQEQKKKLKDQKAGLKVMTDELLDKNTLAMADIGINALNYQVDLYSRSLSAKKDKEKVEKELRELENGLYNETNQQKRNKIQNDIIKKKYEMRNYIGLLDYKDIVVEKNGKKELANPLYLAPENIMAGYGFMANLEEYKSAIRLSWKDFSEKILSEDPKYKLIRENYEKTMGEKITKENSFEIAKKHISGTFDNAHAGTWLKYFKKEEGETEGQRVQRFNKWLNKEAEDMAKEGIIKHIHFNDTQAKDDDHNLLGQGILDIHDLRERLRGAGIKEALIVEAGGRGPNQHTHILNAFDVLNPTLRKENDGIGYTPSSIEGSFDRRSENVSDWVTTKREYENRYQFSQYGMSYNSFKAEPNKNKNFVGSWSGTNFL